MLFCVNLHNKKSNLETKVAIKKPQLQCPITVETFSCPVLVHSSGYIEADI